MHNRSRLHHPLLLHLHHTLQLRISQDLADARLQQPASSPSPCAAPVGWRAHKISQTLVSLGIRSAFLSPVDALHGDIGILSDRDVLVLLSKSGATEELLRLVPCARAKGARLVALTSFEGNSLAEACDIAVHLPLQRKLCPFNLALVTSTAIQMVFGDTVTIALMEARNLSKEEYVANHPTGKIGKSLIFKVKDVMKKQNEIPICRESDLIMDQLVEWSKTHVGWSMQKLFPQLKEMKGATKTKEKVRGVLN